MICISVLNNTNENHAIMRKTKSIRNILETVRSENRFLFYGTPNYISATVSLIIFVIAARLIEDACLDTILPISIRWMYYQSVLLLLYVALELIRAYYIKYRDRGKKTKHRVFSGVISIRIILFIIVLSGLVFLPNRYIPTESRIENAGIVIDYTKWGLSKTGFDSNYVKIKLTKDGSCFWYDMYTHSKPLGSKCIVTVRRGIFGMRYVENVVFLVE